MPRGLLSDITATFPKQKRDRNIGHKSYKVTKKLIKTRQNNHTNGINETTKLNKMAKKWTNNTSETKDAKKTTKT